MKFSQRAQCRTGAAGYESHGRSGSMLHLAHLAHSSQRERHTRTGGTNGAAQAAQVDAEGAHLAALCRCRPAVRLTRSCCFLEKMQSSAS